MVYFVDTRTYTLTVAVPLPWSTPSPDCPLTFATPSLRSPLGISRRTRSQEPWTSADRIPAPWECPHVPELDAPYCTLYAPILPEGQENAPSTGHVSVLLTGTGCPEQLLDEAFKGFQLAFPAKYLARNQSLKLLLIHPLIASDCVSADAQLQCYLHLTEGLSG